MRFLLFVPGMIIALSASTFYGLACLSWLHLKFGFLGVLFGMPLLPVVAFVVPVWKGLSTGNWWMLALLPLSYLGYAIAAMSGSKLPGLGDRA